MSEAEQFDLEALKRDYAVSDVVRACGVKLTRSRHEMTGLCPLHVDKTPSFYVYDAEGVWNCFGCGRGGDIIEFVMQAQRVRFKDAVAMITGGHIPRLTPTERQARDEQEKSDYTGAALAIWHRATPIAGTVAETYLREARKITAELPGSLRFVMCRYPGEARPRPALICAAQAVDRQITGIQRIYLKPDGSDRARDVLKGKLSLGNVKGSALRLGPVANKITLIEGPEDGLTLMQRDPGASVWVSLGTSNMHNIELPEVVEEVVLAGDNDDAGRICVERAWKEFEGQGRRVSSIFPDPAFKDFNKELQEAFA